LNEPIQDNAPKPPGLLPKNVQSWLILGLAVLMVLIMWLTGGKKPPPAQKTPGLAPQMAPPAEINEAKIAELQNRIQELQREQLLAQSALAQQTRTLTMDPADSQTGLAKGSAAGASGERAEDPIQAERKKRNYLSLFASNVALTSRKAAPSPTPGKPEGSPLTVGEGLSPQAGESAQLAQLLKEMMPPATPHADSASTADAEPVKKEPNRPAIPIPGPVDRSAGKTYVVFEGTLLETVLINRLDGAFSGPVECLLSTDVYSRDRQHLLIPAGTKVLGETKKVEAFGQTRLAVVFHRLIMPDGYSTSLDQFKGLNQTGDTGLRDQVNNHYLRIFGASLAIGALGAAAESGTSGALTASGTDQIRQGFAQSMSQSAAQILDRFLNILPTVSIREGHRIKIYLSGDLALPDYLNHKMPSDL
jgi:type IV secretory pathway VirB10-like protein